MEVLRFASRHRFLGPAAFAIVLAASGCAEPRWVRTAGAVPDTFATDAGGAMARCKAQAALQVPVVEQVEQVTGLSVVPNVVTGPRVILPSFRSVDVNEAARDTVWKGCMAEHGWTPET